MVIFNVVDVDYQNSCVFTNKSQFSSSLRIIIGVLAKFHE